MVPPALRLSQYYAMREKEIVNMRIQNSTVALHSGRSYQAEQEVSLKSIQRYHGPEGVERTVVSVSNTKTSIQELSGAESLYHSATATAPANGKGRQIEQAKTKGQSPNGQAQAIAAGQTEAQNWLNAVREAEEDPKVQLFRKCMELIDRLTGKLQSSLPRSASITRSLERMEMKISAATLRYKENMNLGGAVQLLPAGTSPNGYWTRQTISSGFVKGEEHTAFQSTGTVVTADGRTLHFGMSLEMSRSFEKAFVNVGSEAIFTDPLVINMDTDAASLSDVSFYFDLDCDGTEEKISALDGASGFLALDKNGDGKINDGSELFGAQSGDGFADLARYDQDGNGWIDENDEIFSKLRVWTRCGNGESKLLTLKEADVGAIFLGSSATQFGLTDASGEDKAVIRSTGFYLKESGSTGTVQHVDFKT